jgi:hypothetical protein
MADMSEELFDALLKASDAKYVKDEVNGIIGLLKAFGKDHIEEDQCIRKLNAGLIDAFRKRADSCDQMIRIFGESSSDSVQSSLERIKLSRDYCQEMLTMLNMVEIGCEGVENATKAYYEKLKKSCIDQYGEEKEENT